MLCTRFLRFNRLNTLTNHLSKLHIQTNSITPISSISLSEIQKSIYNPWIWQQNDKINIPTNINYNIELPNGLKNKLPLLEPNSSEDVIGDQEVDPLLKKEAVKMIVIRRKKMKKHKLKKLRKRMKFEYAKKRQRREMKKEKLFQAKLINQYKTAEKFSAEEYVEERIRKCEEVTAAVEKLQTGAKNI